MAIDDYSSDKADATPNAVTSPGKYIKIAVPDFMNTGSSSGVGSYLRLGAVEDPSKAGKASGTVGLVVDFEGNALAADENAVINPAYDPYAPFGPHNLPADRTPLPPGSTPQEPPAKATDPANPSASLPDPTGEDLASLVQGFADDSRNRGKPARRHAIANGKHVHKDGKAVFVNTPGGQPRDTGTTAQGPLYGYPWTTPTPGAKAPGQDTGLIDGVTEVPAKPPFFPDDYRTLESSQLHTKGGWRDHTDGNRITTTRGDKVEVIRGNYKLIVLGRQDQTKPKLAGMDISGGQTTSGSGDLSADASTDFNQGSTAYSSLFEWRQCTTEDSIPNLKSALDLEKAANKAEKAAQKAEAKAKDAEPAALKEAADKARKASDAAGVEAEQAAKDAADAATKAQTLLTAQQQAIAAAQAASATAAPAALAKANKTAKQAQTDATNAEAKYAAAIRHSTNLANTSTDKTAYAELAEGKAAGALGLARGDHGKKAAEAAALGAQGVWEGTAPTPAQQAIVDAVVAIAIKGGTEEEAALAAANAAANAAAATAAANAATSAQEVADGGGSADAAGATAATSTAAAGAAAPLTQAQLDQAAADAKATSDAAAAAAAADPGNAAKTAAAAAAKAAYDAASNAAGAAAAAAQAKADKTASDNAAAASKADPSNFDLYKAAVDAKAKSDASAATAKAAGTPPVGGTPAELIAAAQKAETDMQTAAAKAATSEADAEANPGDSTKAQQAQLDAASLATAISKAQKAWTAAAPVTATDAMQKKNSPSHAVLTTINTDPTTGTAFDTSTATATQVKAAATAANAAAVAIATVHTIKSWSKESPAEKAAGAKAKKDEADAKKKEAKAEKQAALAQAAEMGIDITPLQELGLFESRTAEENDPPDYRSVSTTKKGSGPKVQVKYQKGTDPLLQYDQGEESLDGRTFAQPISPGVSVNETWSYQTYNYTGIGYYPTTQPQPWDDIHGPPPPKTQMESGDKTQPIQPPKRGKLAKFPDKPEWVIFPAYKTVTKSYNWNTSSETYVNRTITITAGPRLPTVEDVMVPIGTTPTGSTGLPGITPFAAPIDPVLQRRLDFAQKPTKTYAFDKDKYDRDLLHDDKVKFPLLPNLWVLMGVPIEVPEFTKVTETWGETHVDKQTTIVRAGQTVSDTIVNSTYTMVHAGATTTNTTVGTQHTILNASNTMSETTVGTQHSVLNAQHTVSENQVMTASSTSIGMASSAMSITDFQSTMALVGAKNDMSLIALSAAVKAVLIDLSITIGLMKLDITVKPAVKLSYPSETDAKLNYTQISEMRTLLNGGNLEVTDPTGNKVHMGLTYQFY